MSRIFLACLAMVFPGLAACDASPPAQAPDSGKRRTESAIAAEPQSETTRATPRPFEYPPPVSGGIGEINVGTFSLVDGIAYPAADGSGTVVYAVSKAIASPILKNSGCLRAHADALALLRDAGFAEVTLDAEGVSPYFGYGKLVGGTSRDLTAGGTQWRSAMKTEGSLVKGSVKHRDYGSFEFELPLGKNPAHEGGGTPAKLLATYDKIRKAVAAGDLAGVLQPQGFDAEQIEAIRGLRFIDRDLAAFAERFLAPGDPDPDTIHPGGFYVDGTSPGGKHYWNMYGFVRCGEFLVLTSISEQAL